jgi:hypothetical protein
MEYTPTKDIEQLVRLAKLRVEEGVIHEPRGYCDIIALNQQDSVGLATNGDAGIFRNGEKYPVKITHMCMATGYLDQTDDEDQIRNIQRISINMRAHDAYYMNRASLPAPLWGNKVVAGNDMINFGTSAWRFSEGRFVDQGGSFILSTRDTLRVTARVLAPVEENVGALPVTVSFTGYGLQSCRPYILSSTSNLTNDGQVVDLDVDDYRNDGGEPIMITDMTASIAGDTVNTNLDLTGNIYRLQLQVSQAGNGTNQDWFSGPIFGNPETPFAPAQLLGITSGRAIVHEFPVPMVWEPGQGVSLSGTITGSSPPDSFLNIGLFGYIMVM